MKKKPYVFVISLVYFFAVALVLWAIWVEKKFGNISVDAVVFHLEQSLDGVPLLYSLSFAKRLPIAAIISGILVYIHLSIIHKHDRKILRMAMRVLPFSFLLFSMSYFAVKLSIFDYFLHGNTESVFIEENYTIPNLSNLIFPEQKRNVIILSLESMETTFYSDKLFGQSLIPHLKKIQESNISCKLEQGHGMSWTVASITGLLFGLPLKLPIGGNNYQSKDGLFLPSATSLLEVFEANGYELSFILGSDGRFAGVKNLLTNHSKSVQIYDRDFFEKQGFVSSGDWGIVDSDLYKNAKNIITNLSKSGSPFIAIVQTIDTHNEASVYGDFPQRYGDSRDSFIAADSMASEFLSWLAEQDFYQNTTVLILGDHLYMNNNLSEIPLGVNRSIYNVFLNTVATSKVTEMRMCSMLDMAPSLLESIGVGVPQGRFGLGRSIFSSLPTLVEEYGISELNILLNERSKFYDKFFMVKNK